MIKKTRNTKSTLSLSIKLSPSQHIEAQWHRHARMTHLSFLNLITSHLWFSSSVTYHIGDSDVASDSHGHFAVGRWAGFWGWVSCVCFGYWISYVRFYDHWILCANLLLWDAWVGCTVGYLISSGILWLLDITMWIFFSGSPMRDTWSQMWDTVNLG